MLVQQTLSFRNNFTRCESLGREYSISSEKNETTSFNYTVKSVRLLLLFQSCYHCIALV